MHTSTQNVKSCNPNSYILLHIVVYLPKVMRRSVTAADLKIVGVPDGSRDVRLGTLNRFRHRIRLREKRRKCRRERAARTVRVLRCNFLGFKAMGFFS